MSICHRSSSGILAAAILAGRLLVLPALAQEPSSPEAPPPVRLPAVSGSVTLPYGELKALWEAAQPKPVPAAPAKTVLPPVAFSIQAARYRLAFDGEAHQVTGEAVFDVLAFGEGWTSVPLLPAGELLLSSVEPDRELVAIRDGHYTLFLDGAGRRSITLRFSAELPGNGSEPRSLRLSLPPALVNEMTVSGVPDGWLVEAANAVRSPLVPPAPPSDGADKTAAAPARFQLAANQPLVLTLVNARDRQPAPPPAPSAWQGEAQSLVRYDEGRLVYNTRLRLGADAGAGLSAELILPPAANVLAVHGVDLDRWRSIKAEAADARHLEIAWKTTDVLQRELFVEYEITQPSLEGDWRLLAPQIASAGSRLLGALFALPKIDGVEFAGAGEGSQVLPTGEPQQLPHWLGGQVGDGAFVTVGGDPSGTPDNSAAVVRVRRLPLLHTARATIDESRFRTRLVADGALLSEGSISVQHDAPMTLTLILPKEAQLLSCSIDKQDALPVDRGAGRIDLALPAGSRGKSTRIDLSYTDHRAALAPVAGEVALSLPETDLFVQTLFWDLQIPESYELTALEGNVALEPVSSAPTAGPPLIHLRKDLLKAERPVAGLFYQKRAVAP